MRADVFLTEQGFFESRQKAQKAIEAGWVRADGQVLKKPSAELSAACRIEVTCRMPYVSRGGEKLKKALSDFGLSVSGLSCGDFGASTGGFTDCMLQEGAAAVTAIDVGHGQLHPSLAADERVKSVEGFNLHHATAGEVGRFDFVAADLSFISLTEILPLIFDCLTAEGHAVCLIKPQFEAGRQALDAKGVVKHPKDRLRAIGRVCTGAEALGFSVAGLCESPFPGQSGNLEYLVHIRKTAEPCALVWQEAAERLTAGVKRGKTQ